MVWQVRFHMCVIQGSSLSLHCCLLGCGGLCTIGGHLVVAFSSQAWLAGASEGLRFSAVTFATCQACSSLWSSLKWNWCKGTIPQRSLSSLPRRSLSWKVRLFACQCFALYTHVVWVQVFAALDLLYFKDVSLPEPMSAGKAILANRPKVW